MLFGHDIQHSAKFKWLLYVIGAVVCVMDATLLILKYQRFAVIEKTKLEVQIPMEMPSITICSNIPCRASYFFRPGISISKHEDRDSRPASDVLLSYLARFNESERFKMGYDNFLFFHGCGYGICQELWFNNLYYGNCVTFNGAMPPEIQAAESRVLGAMMITYKQTMYADISRSRSFVAVIHEPDTAPVFTNPEDLIIGFPGDDIKILISKEDYILQPPPFSSQCIERDSPVKMNQTGIYSILQTPFLYTLENCVQNCLQNLTIRHCNCILPKIPFEENLNNMSICYQCPRIPKEELKNACGCKKPCRYSTYVKKNIIRKTGKLTSREFQKGVSLQSGNASVGVAMQENMISFGLTRLVVQYATNVVPVTREIPEYEFATMLGSVGGLLGLWMGLSIISVFEVILNFFQTCSPKTCRKITE